MKKLDDNGKGLLVAGIVALIVCFITGYFSWQRTQDKQVLNAVKEELVITTADYHATQNELVVANGKLKVESNKNKSLSEELNNIKQELEIANTTISDLTSDEYELIYMGQFKLTAYCSCEICCGYWATVREKDEYGNEIVDTASGALAKANHTIAVDTSVLPFGTEVYIVGLGWYTAEDTGSAVKGKHIDVYYDNHSMAAAQGVQYKDVWMLIKKS